MDFDEEDEDVLENDIFNNFFKSFDDWNVDFFKDIKKLLDKDFAFFKGQPFTNKDLDALDDFLIPEPKKGKKETKPYDAQKQDSKIKKPTRYSFLWHLNSTDPQTNFVEINGERYKVKDFLKKYNTPGAGQSKRPEVLPLIKFNPRVNITLDEKNNLATVSIDIRILAEYLRARKLNIKSFTFNTRYAESEEKGVLDIGFNSKMLILRHHVDLNEKEKNFFEKKHHLRSLNINDCVIIAEYVLE